MKNLIVYFSASNNTKNIAEQIAKQIDCDIVQIEPVKPYDMDYSRYEEIADATKKERDDNIRPAIKNEINIADYDNIFIGYPIWWYTLPMIMFTFFDKYDFTGKTIIPFNTHQGSSDCGTYETIKELEPNATVLEGLPITGTETNRDHSEKISAWLKRIGM